MAKVLRCRSYRKVKYAPRGHLDASDLALSALLICYEEDFYMAERKQKIDGWFARRGYLHFDHPVSFEFANAYVNDPAKVERHSFFPFVGYTKTSPRYKPDLKRVVPKNRDIAYAAHLDSHIYARYSLILADALEEVYRAEGLGNNVLAYRSIGKCNIDFADETFASIVDMAPCVALAFDVSAFFDTLDHHVLKSAWCQLLEERSLPADHFAVFKAITRFATVDRGAVYTKFDLNEDTSNRKRRICSAKEFRERVRGDGMVKSNTNKYGIPQGSPISAILSNAYMLEFDRKMKKIESEVGGCYRRYSDDILWVCPAEYEQAVTEAVYKTLKGVNLKANKEKTERSLFRVGKDGGISNDRPLQYLGFTFDGTRKLIRSQTLARYYRRMKNGVRSAKAAANDSGNAKVYRRNLYSRFSHLGGRNFISYGRRSQIRMSSAEIRKQLKAHWPKLHAELEKE